MNVSSVGIVGAGTMGGGIAQVSALAGLDVIMLDVSDAAISKGIKTISSGLQRLVSKGKLSATDSEAALGRIQTSTDLGSLASTVLVIEAATERVDIKNSILRQLDQMLHPGSILATNTSSISITMLAAATSHPERFIGMHFFNPVPIMPLVEIIPGLLTALETTAACVDFVHKLMKTPIHVKNVPGFAVNRILCPMINEAIFALQEGIASREDIDAGMKLGCNHPIGPLALADLIGLDTLLSIMEVFQREYGDSKYRPAPLLREMVAAGRLGRKSGQGFFAY